ncbi:hypothetical protein Tco_0614229, partial [Tanacetum coccineum]
YQVRGSGDEAMIGYEVRASRLIIGVKVAI